MINFGKTPKYETLFAFGLVAIVTIITYGILIPQLGFYRDDWYMLWAGQSLGSDGIIALFQGDRPFLGWLYALDYSIFGFEPLGWHLYALVLKILGNLAFLYFVRMLWPEKKIETTFAALLFSLYPGYYQQPNAVTFKNLLLAYDAAIVSLILTLLAFRANGRLQKICCVILSLLFSALYLFIYESLLGLELIRIVLVLYVLQQNQKPDWKTYFIPLLRHLWPYFLFVGAFIYWRLFIFQSVRRAVRIDVLLGQYGQSPLYSILNLTSTFLKDLVEIVVLAWFVPFYQFTAEGRLKDILASVVVSLLVISLVVIYLRVFKSFDVYDQDQHIWKHWIWIGLISVCATTIVIVAAGRNVIFGIQWDRYTYQAILGVALLLVGMVYSFVRGNGRQVVLVALIAISVVTHYHSAVYYRDFWSLERQAWQQLSWRAPDLDMATNLVVVLPNGYRLAEEYEVWGPANFVYNPGEELKVTGQVLDDSLYYDLVRGLSEDRQMRSITISRNYKKTLIVSITGPGSCLHVINGTRPEFSIWEDALVKIMAPYSNINQIITDAPDHEAPVKLFGQSDAKSWCYYYQKMDLARQHSDWMRAVQLADEAKELSFKPVDLVEWMPVYEAYANTGRLKDATEIAKRIKSDNFVRTSLCLTLDTTSQWPAGYNLEFIRSTLCYGK